VLYAVMCKVWTGSRSFHVLEADALAAGHQVVLEVVGVGPGGVRKVILIVRLDLLQLLLLSVELGHQLQAGLLVNGRLSYRSTRATLSKLHDDLGLLVFARVGIQRFFSEQFFACPPHGRILRVEVLHGAKGTSI
jgi:hypothetical protein